MDAQLERLAWSYYLLAGLVVLLPRPRQRAVGGAGLALLGLAAAAADAAGAGGATGGFATVNELLALAGLVGVIAALILFWRQRGQPTGTPELLPSSRSSPLPLDPLWLGGLALAVLAPHLLLLGLGAALMLAAAVRAAVRAGTLVALLPLLPAAAGLGTALGLLLTIMGPLGGAIGNLAQGPVSPAAERLLVLLLGSAALLLSGLPPLHRVPWGLQLVPLSAMLLLRLIVPVFPDGLLIWQAPAGLLLTVACIWSALAGRGSQVAVAGGLLAVWSGTRAGTLAGAVLMAWGWLVETGTAIAARRGMVGSRRWQGVVALPAALAALPALTASLRAQVLLSTLAVGGCAVGLLRSGLRGPRPLHPPLY